jgi:hypothetical protein
MGGRRRLAAISNEKSACDEQSLLVTVPIITNNWQSEPLASDTTYILARNSCSLAAHLPSCTLHYLGSARYESLLSPL